MRRSPQVALIVLNWNRPDDTLACLASTARSTYEPLEVYVVDNGSSDGSPERIRKAFPNVRMVRLPENRGYGGGMNAGITAALEGRSDFVLCLSSDMTVDRGFLEPLVFAAEAKRTVPYPALYRGAKTDRPDNAGHRLSYTGLTGPIGDGSRRIPPSEVDYTELPFLPSELLQRIGPYQEDYFAFYEDVDLSLRLRANGWRLSFVPDSRVYHHAGGTTRRVPGLVSYYSVRNRLLLIRDNGSRIRWLVTALHVLLLALPFQLLKALPNSDSKHSPRHLLAGLIDGLLPWRRGVTRDWPSPA